MKFIHITFENGEVWKVDVTTIAHDYTLQWVNEHFAIKAERVDQLNNGQAYYYRDKLSYVTDDVETLQDWLIENKDWAYLVSKGAEQIQMPQPIEHKDDFFNTEMTIVNSEKDNTREDNASELRI